MDDRPIILNRDPKEKQIYVGNANYRFDNKTNARGGILSIILGAVSAVAFGACIYGAYRMKGEGSLVLGAAGFMGLLIALAGFIIGIMSFQEEDRHYVLSRIGVLLNFAIMLLWGSMLFDRDLKTDWKRRNKCPGPV